LPPELLFNTGGGSPKKKREAPARGENGKLSTLEEDTELNLKLQEVYADIYNMRLELERSRKPLGTRDNPVRTCRDLFYGHPHFKDGNFPLFFYWTL
jgi:collagen type V/XI/XXIV/XXVII alpha